MPRRLGAVVLAGCDRCGTQAALPRLSTQELRAIHDSPAYFGKTYFEARRDVQIETVKRVRRVSELVSSVRGDGFLAGRRMLDVGCDTGDFVLAARATAHIDPFGVEISTQSADIASRRSVTVSASDLSDAPDDFDEFALVTAIDVIEHVGEPANLLESIASRLAPDGLVYLETPNWHSAVYRMGEPVARMGGNRPKRIFERLFPPEHVQYFTVDGLRALVERRALQPLVVTTRRLSFSAVAGGFLVKAATWLAQLPDRGADQRILICALLQRREAHG
jgi:SAM-dependent methyltransferase